MEVVLLLSGSGSQMIAKYSRWIWGSRGIPRDFPHQQPVNIHMTTLQFFIVLGMNFKRRRQRQPPTLFNIFYEIMEPPLFVPSNRSASELPGLRLLSRHLPNLPPKVWWLPGNRTGADGGKELAKRSDFSLLEWIVNLKAVRRAASRKQLIAIWAQLWSRRRLEDHTMLRYFFRLAELARAGSDSRRTWACNSGRQDLHRVHGTVVRQTRKPDLEQGTTSPFGQRVTTGA